MHTTLRPIVNLCTAVAVMLLAGSVARGVTAQDILATPDIRSGVCVLLEFDSGQDAETFFDTGVKLVHGLSADAEKVDAAREYLTAKGKHGPVSFGHTDFRKLPLADDIANIVVAEDFATLTKQGLTMGELMRVVAPYGTLFIKGFSGSVPGSQVTRRDDWTLVTKGKVEGTDEWTHFEHGPERTSVSQDMVAEPPSGIRWIAGPYYPFGMQDVGFVSVNGRNFYWYWAHHPGRYGAIEEGSRIECRDAFNGVLLWEKKTPRQTHGAGFVGTEDRLYVHLGEPDNLVALDAASGEEVVRFGNAQDHERSEILVKDGTLVQSANGIRGFDAAHGNMLWEKPNGLTTTDMIVTGGDNLYYLYREKHDTPIFLVCCDLKSGAEQWRAEQNMEYRESNGTEALAIVSFHRGVILIASGSRMEFMSADNKFGALYAVSAADGRLLWSRQYDVVSHKGTPTDVFPIDDEVWVKTRNPELVTHGLYVCLDLMTGEEKQNRKINVGYNRCYPDRAMTRYLLTGNFDFVDIASGETYTLNATRGACNTGFMVAQGLTYTFPLRCMCFNLIRGLLGLACNSPVPDPDNTPATELIRGPAYGDAGSETVADKGWPTFRQNPTRSNSTQAGLRPDLETLWQSKQGGSLSALTVAEGVVFVASVDDHRVLALDAGTGAVKWSFTAGGRIDSPPTFHNGLALFGAADGWVYGLRATDGVLAWKLQVAPLDRRIVVRGQMESPWPVHGSVLVCDDTLYVAAGRNTHTDDGLFYYAIDPATGTVRWKQRAGRERGESNNDVMVQGDRGFEWLEGKRSIHLGHRIHFNPTTGDVAKYGAGDNVMFAPFGLLTDCISNGPVAREDILRRQWAYGRVGISGRARQATHNAKKSALIAVDDGTVYGVTEDYIFDYANRRIWERTLEIHGTGPEVEKGWSVSADASYRMRALISTADSLVLAVQPAGEDKGELWFLSKANGETVAKVPIADVPRWDGMAVADGRLFVTTENGRVLGLGALKR